MTKSVIQMGQDVTSTPNDMRQMISEMQVIPRSMVEGQAGMSVDFAKVRVGRERMTGDMSKMAGDMGALSVNIAIMAASIDTMNQSMATMNQSTAGMDSNMTRMAIDINKFTRPESIMTPFRSGNAKEFNGYRAGQEPAPFQVPEHSNMK